MTDPVASVRRRRRTAAVVDQQETKPGCVVSAGIDYLRNLPHLEQDLPTWRTTPEKCADHGHPGVTYNPWHDHTWCLCGDVVRDGNQLTHSDQWPHLADCCGGPLLERIRP